MHICLTSNAIRGVETPVTYRFLVKMEAVMSSEKQFGKFRHKQKCNYHTACSPGKVLLVIYPTKMGKKYDT
jgi:hypothetical protein